MALMVSSSHLYSCTRLRLSPVVVVLVGERKIANAGKPQQCNVEVRVKAFIPSEIVYAPAPLNFLLNDSYVLVPTNTSPFLVPIQVAAFKGDNRDFDYASNDSKADIAGAFVIREQNFSDIQRIR